MATATSTNVLFPWRDSYSVGFPEIDKQHKVLIGLINSLQDAMMEGRGRAALASIVSELVRYTESHFSFEEALMRQRDYPGLVAHQKQHQDLTRQARNLRDQVQSGKAVITMDVMRFLKDWLANHIQNSDMAYARALKFL